VPEDPFAADESGVSRAAGESTISVGGGHDYERMSPQVDNVAGVAIYNDNGDAERQPLLGIREDDEYERMEVPWAFTLAIAAAIGVATFVILYVWRRAGEEGTLARA